MGLNCLPSACYFAVKILLFPKNYHYTDSLVHAILMFIKLVFYLQGSNYFLFFISFIKEHIKMPQKPPGIKHQRSGFHLLIYIEQYKENRRSKGKCHYCNFIEMKTSYKIPQNYYVTYQHAIYFLRHAQNLISILRPYVC